MDDELRRMQSNRKYADSCYSTSYTSGAYAGNPNLFIRSAGSYATIASCHKTPFPPSPYATTYVTSSGRGSNRNHSHHVYCRPSSVSYYASSPLIQVPQLEPADRVRRLNVPRHTIAIATGSLAQEGAFGRVFRGVYHPHQPGEPPREVVVKTVSEEASMLQVSLLLSEGTVLYGLVHKNVLPVIAANTDPCLPPLLVYPATRHGNLKRYLQRCRAGEHPAPATQQLVDMATQVATAGVYLHSQGIWHRDIATRNCLMGDGFHVQLGDAALSRDLHPGDYHCLGDADNRPIRWLAYEALVHRAFLASADVWSFGVLLWELMTLAQQPYVEVDPWEMADYLRDGYRLSQPLHCPDQLFEVMTCCWTLLPEDRPSFSQLLDCLYDFSNTLGRFI